MNGSKCQYTLLEKLRESVFANFASFKFSNIQVIMPPKSKTKKRILQLNAERNSQNSDLTPVDEDVSFVGNNIYLGTWEMVPTCGCVGYIFGFHKEGFEPEILLPQCSGGSW